MHHSIAAAALAAVLTGPAVTLAATDADIAELRHALEAVNRRLDALEQRNLALETANRQLEERNSKLEEASQSRSATVAPAQAKAGAAAEWASRISWKGDLRYRHEHLDRFEDPNDRTRQRIRARFGMTARVNDTISTTIQLATNGGNNDPRATNQTLGSGLERKGVALDLAYLDWAPAQGLSVQLGKTPYAFQRVASHFWDGDITWEGGSLRYARGPFFGTAYGYWLSESAQASDSNVFGVQVGLRSQLGPAKVTAAAHYYDLGAVQNEVTAAVPGPGAPCPAASVNNAFFGGAQGNTTFLAGNCARLVHDYDVYELLAQAETNVGSLPLTLFVNYARNTAAGDLDTAYAAGFTLGRASEPRSWEFGYVYQVTEKDALFGQFVDSDFGDGVTDVDGSSLRLGFAPARNWTLNAQYYDNQRFNDRPTSVGGIELSGIDYQRLQLDFNVRF